MSIKGGGGKGERGSARKPYCDWLPCLYACICPGPNPLIFQSDGHVGLVVLDACVLQLGQVHLHEGTHQLLPVQGGGSALTNVAAAFWILQVTTLPLTWQLKTRIIINLPPLPEEAPFYNL